MPATSAMKPATAKTIESRRAISALRMSDLPAQLKPRLWREREAGPQMGRARRRYRSGRQIEGGAPAGRIARFVWALSFSYRLGLSLTCRNRLRLPAD